MIYITGDCHGDFRRFSTKNFPDQKNMTKDDYVIICGDFGGIWFQKDSKKIKEENYWLDWLNSKPFTTLFVCGNHENFERLYQFPVEKWNGGKVHRVRDSIFHLMRGEVFRIQGKSFFAFGGAASHDISDGIIEMDDDWKKKARRWQKQGKMFRVKGLSWWEQELPTEEELMNGMKNLDRVGRKIDYIITHSLYSAFVKNVGYGIYETDSLMDYFEEIKNKVEYKKWFSGHYHVNMNYGDKEVILYEQITRIS